MTCLHLLDCCVANWTWVRGLAASCSPEARSHTRKLFSTSARPSVSNCGGTPLKVGGQPGSTHPRGGGKSGWRHWAEPSLSQHTFPPLFAQPNMQPPHGESPSSSFANWVAQTVRCCDHTLEGVGDRSLFFLEIHVRLFLRSTVTSVKIPE